eukprot:CAMPEP_0170887864 /NCGR_PEP_ID=MMETSP0734-20130129/37998_1 /TAXON_ID=186038 /ORGANISM="Fragilariopsis kerguelensis, Strain L26-C5" /LENGTH=53 /DNA_ID=CAMNT_0011275087 /DNA_START=249 /DNA_END=407 /DNA_ORIENTATION=-
MSKLGLLLGTSDGPIDAAILGTEDSMLLDAPLGLSLRSKLGYKLGTELGIELG